MHLRRVRAALFSVEEAARISRESVPNDGGVVKEHDGSLGEGLSSYQGHFPVDDCAVEYLPSAKVQREQTPPWRQEHKRSRVRPSTRVDGQDRSDRSTRLKRQQAGHGCLRKSGKSSGSDDACLSGGRNYLCASTHPRILTFAHPHMRTLVRSFFQTCILTHLSRTHALTHSLQIPQGHNTRTRSYTACTRTQSNTATSKPTLLF